MNDPDRFPYDNRPVESVASVYWALVALFCSIVGLGVLLVMLSDYLSHG
jgi:hypothetical protein